MTTEELQKLKEIAKQAEKAEEKAVGFEELAEHFSKGRQTDALKQVSRQLGANMNFRRFLTDDELANFMSNAIAKAMQEQANAEKLFVASLTL